MADRFIPPQILVLLGPPAIHLAIGAVLLPPARGRTWWLPSMADRFTLLRIPVLLGPPVIHLAIGAVLLPLAPGRIWWPPSTADRSTPLRIPVPRGLRMRLLKTGTAWPHPVMGLNSLLVLTADQFIRVALPCQIHQQLELQLKLDRRVPPLPSLLQL